MLWRRVKINVMKFKYYEKTKSSMILTNMEKQQNRIRRNWVTVNYKGVSSRPLTQTSLLMISVSKIKQHIRIAQDNEHNED